MLRQGEKRLPAEPPMDAATLQPVPRGCRPKRHPPNDQTFPQEAEGGPNWTPTQPILKERDQILQSEDRVQRGVFYILDAVNRRVDHLPKRKLTALKDAKTYDYSIKLHSEQAEAKASLKPLMASLSFRF